MPPQGVLAVKVVQTVQVLKGKRLRNPWYVHISQHSLMTDLFLQSTSFMSSNTDDDDITAFVRDIEDRKPLRAPGQESRLPPKRPLGATSSPRPLDDDSSGVNGSREPMLTSVSAVDEKLREMNEAFTASLAGLSRGPEGSRRLRSDSSPSGPIRRRLGAQTPDVDDPGIMMIGRNPRPRYGSMGSVRSGASIASEEVIGKLELEEKRSRSHGM